MSRLVQCGATLLIFQPTSPANSEASPWTDLRVLLNVKAAKHQQRQNKTIEPCCFEVTKAYYPGRICFSWPPSCTIQRVGWKPSATSTFGGAPTGRDCDNVHINAVHVHEHMSRFGARFHNYIASRHPITTKLSNVVFIPEVSRFHLRIYPRPTLS